MSARANWMIFVNRSFFGVDVFIAQDLGNDKLLIPTAIEWTEHDPSKMVPPDSYFTLGPGGSQMLIDRLWEAGLRPSKGVSSTGQDEAQKAHIADLRDIVRNLLHIGEAKTK